MGDVSYRPLIEDMTWSYSRVSSFADCPYAWFLHYIHGEEEAPMFYASYGSFVHSLIERYYRGELRADELPSVFLQGFSSQVEGKRPPDETVFKYIHSGLDYFRSFKPFPYEPLAIEERLEFDLDGIPFVAYPDFVGHDGDSVGLVDHKSRLLKPRSNRKKPTAKDVELDEMLRQLYLYAHGIRQKYGVFPSELCFNCFRGGVLIREPFCQAAYEAAKDWAKREIECIAEEENFRPRLDFFRCHWICPFHKECCYYQDRGDAY